MPDGSHPVVRGARSFDEPLQERVNPRRLVERLPEGGDVVLSKQQWVAHELPPRACIRRTATSPRIHRATQKVEQLDGRLVKLAVERGLFRDDSATEVQRELPGTFVPLENLNVRPERWLLQRPGDGKLRDRPVAHPEELP